MKETLINLLEGYSHFDEENGEVFIYHTAELNNEETKKIEDLFKVKLININNL